MTCGRIPLPQCYFHNHQHLLTSNLNVIIRFCFCRFSIIHRRSLFYISGWSVVKLSTFRVLRWLADVKSSLFISGWSVASFSIFQVQQCLTMLNRIIASYLWLVGCSLLYPPSTAIIDNDFETTPPFASLVGWLQNLCTSKYSNG